MIKKSDLKKAKTQKDINKALETLSETHEVFTVKKGESVERLGEMLMQRAYYERVEAEAQSIYDEWKEGIILSYDRLSEALDELHVHSDNDALDVLRWTDGWSAYADNYGEVSDNWTRMAYASLREDVLEKLQRMGMNVSDPGEYTIDCNKCGTRPCEDGDTKCPSCGEEPVTEGVIFEVRGDMCCADCLDSDDEEVAIEQPSGTEAICIGCGDRFVVPK